MGSAFAEVYYKLVKAGSKTIDQVPENLKSDVQRLLDAETQSEEDQ